MTDALFLELEALVGPATMTELCKRYLGHVPLASASSSSASEHKEDSLSVTHCAICMKNSCTPFTCMTSCPEPKRSPLLMPPPSSPAKVKELQKEQGYVPDAEWDTYRSSALDNAFFGGRYMDHEHRPSRPSSASAASSATASTASSYRTTIFQNPRGGHPGY